jgi:hypothetical protein
LVVTYVTLRKMLKKERNNISIVINYARKRVDQSLIETHLSGKRQAILYWPDTPPR